MPQKAEKIPGLMDVVVRPDALSEDARNRLTQKFPRTAPIAGLLWFGSMDPDDVGGYVSSLRELGLKEGEDFASIVGGRLTIEAPWIEVTQPTRNTVLVRYVPPNASTKEPQP